MEVKELLPIIFQGIALFILIIGVFLTVTQIKQLKYSLMQNHKWNRLKAAHDAIEKYKGISKYSKMLDEKLEFVNAIEVISLKKIMDEIEKDKSLQSAIHYYLNYFETLSIGILQSIFDEEVIKSAYKTVMMKAYQKFSSYIKERRLKYSSNVWNNLESLIKKWQSEDSIVVKRKETG